MGLAVPGEVQETIPLSERLMNIVPENPIAALAEGNILAIIFFSLLVGVGVLTVGEKAKPIADFMEAGMEVIDLVFIAVGSRRRRSDSER